MSKVDELQRIAVPVVERHGCDLVLMTLQNERQGRILRLLVERKGSDPFTGSGVDHALCASISRDLGDALDADDVVTNAFVLEVSSPGIERPLVRPGDFARFAGRPVSVKTMRAIDGQKRFTGTIGGIEGEDVTLVLGRGAKVVIPYDQIGKANLVFDHKKVDTKTGE